MKVTYDPRYNIAYIYIHPKRADAQAIRLSDEIIIDIAPDGTVYGIELLNANEQLRGDNAGKISVINEATGEHAELPLLIP